MCSDSLAKKLIYKMIMRPMFPIRRGLYPKAVDRWLMTGFSTWDEVSRSGRFFDSPEKIAKKIDPALDADLLESLHLDPYEAQTQALQKASRCIQQAYIELGYSKPRIY